MASLHQKSISIQSNFRFTYRCAYRSLWGDRLPVNIRELEASEIKPTYKQRKARRSESEVEIDEDNDSDSDADLSHPPLSTEPKPENKLE